MERLDGRIDLAATMESGQLFHWRRIEPGDAGADVPDDVEPVGYVTTADGEPVRLQQAGDGVGCAGAAEPAAVRRLLGLDAPLDAIVAGFDDEAVERAVAASPGLRVVADDPWRSLVSFLCSPQSSVARIGRLVNRIADRYGEPLDGVDVATFPDAATVAEEATEDALRELKLGYRAPYVLESARAIADGDVDLEAIAAMPYEEAHAEIQRLHGVGDKVADCVLLFGLGFDEAVPLDRWMWRALEAHYPGMSSDDYVEARDAFRERFGDRAGYAQNFLFHHVRTGGEGAVSADD
jgi:N-glycosylase/DNA lyase